MSNRTSGRIKKKLRYPPLNATQTIQSAQYIFTFWSLPTYSILIWAAPSVIFYVMIDSKIMADLVFRILCYQKQQIHGSLFHCLSFSPNTSHVRPKSKKIHLQLRHKVQHKPPLVPPLQLCEEYRCHSSQPFSL